VIKFKNFSSLANPPSFDILSEKQQKDIKETIKHLQCPITKKPLQMSSIRSPTTSLDEFYVYSNLNEKEGSEPRIVAYKIVDGLVRLRSVDAQILPAIK
jgi:hypothetical protein